MAQASHDEVAEITKLSSPPKFNVILLNDDSTPQDFVVIVLQQTFNKTLEDAKAVMLDVH